MFSRLAFVFGIKIMINVMRHQRLAAGIGLRLFKREVDERSFYTETNGKLAVDRNGCNALAVEEDAVAAVEIAQQPLIAFEQDFGVAPADVFVGDADVAIGDASDLKGLAEFEFTFTGRRFEGNAQDGNIGRLRLNAGHESVCPSLEYGMLKARMK